MKIDDELLKKILHLSGKDKKRVVVNDRYYCTFVDKDMKPVDDNYYVFSECWKEDAFPSYTQYAEVFVYDSNISKGHHEAGFAKLYHMNHTDSNTHSFFLMLKDKTLAEAISIKLEDEIFPLDKFMKLIDEKNVGYEILSPYENIGLTIVEFERINDVTASIEYDVAGKLYFEVIDWSDIKEFEVIPLDSDKRKFVLNYVQLTNENAIALADHINRALAKRKTMKGNKDYGEDR